MKLLAVLAAFLFTCPNSPAAQQVNSPASPQASALLAQSLAAMVGPNAPTDVSLSGTARRVAGPDDETGTGVLKAISGGASRMDLTLPSGTWNEILSTSLTQPSGSWTGPDGLSHDMAFHNLLAGSSWFFPAFPIAKGLSSASYVVTYIGHETHNGQPVEHISVSQTSPASLPQTAVSLQTLSKLDFLLDSSTLLPAAMIFNTHPDKNALIDIPVEVRFSDYRPVNGALIAYHIQKYLNGSLILDFQAQTAALNSGLPASQFAAQ